MIVVLGSSLARLACAPVARVQYAAAVAPPGVFLAADDRLSLLFSHPFVQRVGDSMSVCVRQQQYCCSSQYELLLSFSGLDAPRQPPEPQKLSRDSNFDALSAVGGFGVGSSPHRTYPPNGSSLGCGAAPTTMLWIGAGS